jgi:hypothetical protein
MGYSVNNAFVEAALFKSDHDLVPIHGTVSAKWYETHALDMSEEYNDITPVDAVQNAWRRSGRKLNKGWTLVVLEPYHRSAYPVLIRGI